MAVEDPELRYTVVAPSRCGARYSWKTCKIYLRSRRRKPKPKKEGNALLSYFKNKASSVEELAEKIAEICEEKEKLKMKIGEKKIEAAFKMLKEDITSYS